MVKRCAAVVLAGFFFAGFSTTFALSDTAGPQALTLRQAFRLALKKSETLAMKKEEIAIAQGHFYQALNTVMPNVHFLMTRFDQDASESGSGSTVTNSSRRSTPEKRFTFSQPLFSGFKELAAIQASGAEKKQKAYEYQRAEELLFVNVMEAFYNLAAAQRDVKILESAQKTLDDRVAELHQRVKLGKSRESEAQSAVADQKTTQAELLDARRLEVVSRQLLEFYIGRQIVEDLAEEANLPEMPAELESYLEKAKVRSDVKAAGEAYELLEKGVTVAQADLFPTVRLDGNYYTQRVGFQSGNDWDVLLTFDIPVFNGTETFGNIKVAAAQRDQARYNLQDVTRRAGLDVRNAYEDYISSRERETAYAQAAEALKKNYELQAQDYRLNLVNNLDVLDALRRYEDTGQTANQARYDARRNYWMLRVAIGGVLDAKTGELLE